MSKKVLALNCPYCPYALLGKGLIVPRKSSIVPNSISTVPETEMGADHSAPIYDIFTPIF